MIASLASSERQNAFVIAAAVAVAGLAVSARVSYESDRWRATSGAETSSGTQT